MIRRQAENALEEIAELTGFKGTLIRFFLRLNGDQIAKQKKLIKRIRKTSKPTIKIKKQVINEAEPIYASNPALLYPCFAPPDSRSITRQIFS